MKTEDLITLNEEIAGMARAGLPLDKGLAALAREMGRGRLQKVTAQLAADLEAGHPLPEAIARQGKHMPPFYAGLVEAAIRTGRVNEVLATLALYGRTVTNLRMTIIDAVWYPAVISLFALLMFGALFGFFLPEYDKLISEFDLHLPLFSRGVLALSKEPLAVFVVPAAVFLGLVVAIHVALRFTSAGRRRWARWVYAIPIIGTLLRAARLASFTELLAILVDYELPLPRAFELAGIASSDPIMAAAAPVVVADLRQGEQLGAIMRKRRLVPELVGWMTALGEQHGTLGKTLHHVSDLYRRQVEMRAVLLKSVLPPFLLFVTAAVIGFVFVFVLIMPMIKLMEGLSK
jgi:type II secretory pathway component PulF